MYPSAKIDKEKGLDLKREVSLLGFEKISGCLSVTFCGLDQIGNPNDLKIC